MRLEERDLKYLWDMVDAARRARTFLANLSLEQYLASELHRFAIERVVEIVGEAARRVSDDARRRLPDVPWGAIVATRHILAHDYDIVDHDKIWRVATIHIPELIQQLEPVLAANPPGPESQTDPAQP